MLDIGMVAIRVLMGKKHENMGLKKTEHISEIIVHPDNLMLYIHVYLYGQVCEIAF